MTLRHTVAPLAAVLLLTLTSCREAPLAPATARERDSATAPGPVEPGVLTLRMLRADVIDGTLRVRAVIATPPGERAFYSSQEVGGWFVQLFLNTDQSPTGYAAGYELVVRGGEPTGASSCPVRRTDGGNGPGGWGDAVGEATLDVDGRTLLITVPLASIDADGRLDYALETYVTVACDACEGGIGAEFTSGMSGTTDSRIARHQGPAARGRLADRRQPGL